MRSEQAVAPHSLTRTEGVVNPPVRLSAEPSYETPRSWLSFFEPKPHLFFADGGWNVDDFVGCIVGPLTWTEAVARTEQSHGDPVTDTASGGSSDTSLDRGSAEPSKPCPRCDRGTVKDANGSYWRCAYCKGTGRVAA